jgi:NAD+ synthase (glutamine-hydrolysing)
MVYSNCKGCDGQRTLFDGCPFVVMNGKLLGFGEQFKITEVEVISVRLDLSEIERYRMSAAPSRSN